MLDFQDTKLAFQAKNDKDLRKSYYLFKMISVPVLADIGPKMMSWAFEWGLPVQGIVKNTLFQQFCGGISIENTVTCSDALYRFGVKTILDYSVEGEKTEAGFDATAKEIVATLQHGGKQASVAFTACKLTGLAEFDLLEKVSEGKTLSETEAQAFGRVRKRLNDICQAAQDNDTPVFIDAEESWIQAAIDALAEEMMEKYNKHKPLVYNTIQLYRHDRLAYLTELIQKSETKQYFLGVKLVRGAYMEKENARAEKLNYLTPIQPNKAATDKDYDAALKLCVDHIERVAICAGSHNEQSAMLLTELMAKKGLTNEHPHILFAQLLGMSDHISFNLAHHKYNVAKYLPYGPVKAVMPYLMRRAQENTAIKGEAGRELTLLKKEIKRRGL